MAIEDRVGEVLRDRSEFVAAAESCTGGLVGSRITDVAGASDYFDRSYVTYTSDAKLEELGVPREDLEEAGAVSEPVARAMARGARDGAGVAWGLATTGIAGPTGGTADKPVGTVYIGVAYGAPWGTGESRSTVARYEFDGTRTEIKDGIADRALADLVGAAEGS